MDTFDVPVHESPRRSRRRTSTRNNSSTDDHAAVVTRRTRLTTELHYSAHLDDLLLLEMDDATFMARCRELDIDVDGM